MLISLKSNNKHLKSSCFKFYRRTVECNFELMSKVENPHQGSIEGCYHFTHFNGDGFISFSKDDVNIKLWGSIKRKK